MSRCIQTDLAERFRRGGLADTELVPALRHATVCADCRHRLFAAGDPELDASAMAEIQDRLAAWRAARRAPLMPAFPWVKGREIDRYVIIRSVGGTDDGVVYEAFDTEREERVVVKQLDLRVDDPAAPALIAIAQRLCQLAHRNILQMLSVGVHAGSVYIVYQLVKGAPLSQAGGSDSPQLIALFTEAARGLAAAHDAGIVHGCFSPGSCVVGRDGSVRVVDFAIGESRTHRTSAARSPGDWTFTGGSQVGSDDSFVGFVPSRRRPTSGEFESIVLAAGPNSLGPRIYAAPELVLGHRPTPASDQFAFCAALFHRLYGHPPFAGETIALWLRALLHGQITPPPARADVPARVQAAILRGLSRDPAARFDRMASLIGELTRHHPVLRRPRLVIGAVATGLAIAAIAIIATGLGNSTAAISGPARCSDALAGWDDMWSASHQEALAHASGAGGDTWPALRKRFDAWLTTWRTATHNFCRAPDRVSLDCASRAHAAAVDLLALVESGASQMVRAAAATDALATADDCASLLPSPATAPLVAVRADVRRRLGLYEDADQLTAQLPDDAVQRSYLTLVRGHTAADRGDLIEARRLFEAAAFDAHAIHQGELDIVAAIQRLSLACSSAERTLWSGYLSPYLAAALPHSHASAQIAYRAALADSLSCEGKLGESLALRQQVAAALRAEPTPAGAAAALALARTRLAQSDLAAAEPAARDAAAIYAQSFGVHHPLSETARLALAEAQLISAPASAVATVDAVLAELADRKEPDAVRGRALLLQARLADARGDAADAVHLAQRAAGEFEAALGGAHPELARAQLLAGDFALAAGRAPEAEAAYRQVAAIFDTLGQSESAALAHARAGLLLARWGNRPPLDADELLRWGLAPTGDTVDPAVAAWVADQLAHRAASRGDATAALAHYRAAATAWQDAGDPLNLAGSLASAGLLAAQLHAADARSLIERSLSLSVAPADKPRLQAALAKLLWPTEHDRARSLARAALLELPDSSPEAAELQHWLTRHEADR